MHIWALTGLEPTDPTYLHVQTDDDGLVTELQPPSYRAADVATRTLMLGWEQYEAPAPEVKDITQLQVYITATYGDQTYMLRSIR